MLLAMSLRRVPPLPVALALVAAALIAAAWTTRSAVVDAFAAVRDGQAVVAQQTIRADLAELGSLPDSEQLGSILRERADDGVRYLAILDGRRIAVEAGESMIAPIAPGRRAARGGLQLHHAGGRTRIEVAAGLRRPWPTGRRWRIAVELESSQAASLRAAATRTLAVGALAAVVLIAIAVWLVRGELRRRAHERERERERRLASLGEMSAVLAHEIRNPLASLKGNAQLLAASLPQGEKPRAKAERVVDEAIRLERLTGDLLAFVRTGEIARTPVDVLALVRDAAGAIADGAVHVDVNRAPRQWSLDAARMHQVLVNLLENAIAAGAPATVSVCNERGTLAIDITDKGPGVPPSDRDKVFEPFFTSKTKGTGLGLAIARRVVEQHRGTLTVDDAPGGGARFRIVIPERGES